MRLFKRHRYYFSDSSMASDTIIAFVLGGISFVAELSGVISSIATKGNVSGFFAMLYICALVLSFTGIIFAYLGFKSQTGGVKEKRISVALNIFTILVPFIIILF